MSNLETSLFIKTILQGYIYFKDRKDKNKIHKGFVVKYEADIAYFKQHLEVAYGVHYYFNHLVNGKRELWLDDCEEEIIKNPEKHPAHKECFNYGLTLESYQLDFGHYGISWALDRKELEHEQEKNH